MVTSVIVAMLCCLIGGGIIGYVIGRARSRGNTKEKKDANWNDVKMRAYDRESKEAMVQVESWKLLYWDAVEVLKRK